MPDIRVRNEVLQLLAPETSWLSTGWDGGRIRADAAYNCTVPDGWDRTDLDEYIAERRTQAGFEHVGPTLLTGVEMTHARCARLTAERDAGDKNSSKDSIDVLAVATAGVSNPATLFPEEDTAADPESHGDSDTEHPEPGTVNLLVHVDHPLAAGALANLIAVVAEAKAATLLRETGFPGTTTDAVIVGAGNSSGGVEPIRFTGSGTPIGAAARACVRDALQASLGARYDETPVPETVADAEYGVVTDRSANVFRP
ncbi:adenosylcobinamide amidohydrolase [Natranaeroarchaeum aerophilus]|uniref:Adenosylcobinamide amidohydrolase n=1 Tax=Natranaeroarchaeum aerophilus TaxID=2917711 RepID=A0AAE3K5Z9_9EURY|nr:adenosylcobinamide amidohydrolase [Natranaeroarchaeum aerophilus]MCL9814483.1 adenosylcobinamide amidohydrolase [Natranaeroarchaeum aerophilus]